MSRPWEWPVNPDGCPSTSSQEEDARHRIAGAPRWEPRPVPEPAPYYPARVGRRGPRTWAS